MQCSLTANEVAMEAPVTLKEMKFRHLKLREFGAGHIFKVTQFPENYSYAQIRKWKSFRVSQFNS